LAHKNEFIKNKTLEEKNFPEAFCFVKKYYFWKDEIQK